MLDTADLDLSPDNLNWLLLRLAIANLSPYDGAGRVKLPPDEAQTVRNEIGELTQKIWRAQMPRPASAEARP